MGGGGSTGGALEGRGRVSKGSIGSRLRVGDKVGKGGLLLEDKVDLVSSETEFGELVFVKDMPGTVSDLDRLVEKNATGRSIVVARIGVDRREGLAGSAGKLDLSGCTFGPSAGGSTCGPGGGSGFVIAILVDGKAVLGELEHGLFSFLGGRNLILGASFERGVEFALLTLRALDGPLQPPRRSVRAQALESVSKVGLHLILVFI